MIIIASYNKENTIILSSCIITIVLLFKYIPKNKVREAHVPFLFQQTVTWFFGLLVVEKNFIKYPYRPYFKKSNKSGFSFEYFIYPALTSLFNVCYPEKRGILFKAFYTFSYSGAVTLFEILIEKYTDLITYKKWSWHWSFITMSFTYYLSRLYSRWFFKSLFNKGRPPFLNL
ncbi:CBO0543 family protein [Alkalihalobacillus deserti]|uniref:CBO0543 family protein n=1 Tax=Alkalihalobacillus deserti TaxID=2879466 RepID=UPI0027DEEBF2|nr:CBO0543 family protein [Alkalihalobacillus deserti]